MLLSRTLRPAALSLLLCPGLALAETPPGWGELLRNDREPVSVQPLERPKVEKPAPAPVPPMISQGTIRLEQLRISGNTLFSEAELRALVADGEGKDVSLADLQALAARISRHYADRGYPVAFAYLPPQEIVKGVVTIAVVEGRVEDVRGEDTVGLPQQLLESLRADIARDEPVRRADLERAVLLHNSVPGITANARLRPGDATGGTVVVMETRPGREFAGDVTLDNYGDLYTGEETLGIRFIWNNPNGDGDQWLLRMQTAGEGRLYGRIAYDFAMPKQWRGNISAGSSTYTLGDAFESLDADGSALTGTFEARYPLVLRADLRLHAQLAADYMQLVDRVGALSSERDKDLVDGRAGLSLQMADTHGQTAASVMLTSGNLSINDDTELVIDQSTAETDGTFSKIGLVVERQQSLPAAFRLRLGASLQQAFGNLTSAQKLAIGGPYAVRAYPVGEASGDNVRLASLELRRPFNISGAGTLSPLVFADYGHAELNNDTWAGFVGDNTRELSGAGIGAEWTGPKQLTVTAYNAWTASSEPVTAEPDSESRFWLSARWSF